MLNNKQITIITRILILFLHSLLSRASLSSALPPSSSSSCVNLNSTSVCQNVLSYTSIWAPPNQTCTDMNEQKVSLLPTLLAGITSTSCQQAVASYMCQSAYSPCSSNSSGNSVQQPQPPCRSTCDNLTSICPSSVISSLSLLGFNVACSSLPSTSCQLFPNSTASPPPPPPSSSSPSSPPPPSSSLPSYPQCVAYNGTVCKGIVNWNVYVPAGYTLAQMEYAAQEFEFLNAITPTLGNCRTSLAQLYCSLSFPKCDYSNTLSNLTSLSLPLPSFPCHSVCDTYSASCGLIKPAMLANSPLLAAFLNIDCNGDGASTLQKPVNACGNLIRPALKMFPINNTVWASINGIPITSSCHSYSTTELSTAVVGVCPAPLVRTPNAEAALTFGNDCALPCPSIEFSTDEWEHVNRIMQVLPLLSFIFITFVVLTWATFPEKRKQTYVLSLTCSLWVLSLVFMIQGLSYSNPSKAACKNQSELVQQSDGGFCVVQAVFIHFFFLSTISWWFLIALDLFIKVVLKPSRFTPKQHVMMKYGFHIWGWGAPCFWVIVCASLKLYGATDGIPWCFSFYSNTEWGMVYGYMFVCIFFVIIAIFSISFLLYRTSASFHSKNRWIRHIRPLFFLVFFTVVFMYLASFRVDRQKNKDVYEQSARDFVTCLLGPRGSMETCGSHPAIRTSISTWYGAVGLASAQGLLVFLIYGVQLRNYYLWKNLITGNGLWLTGSTSGSRNNSHSTKSTTGGPSALVTQMSMRQLNSDAIAPIISPRSKKLATQNNPSGKQPKQQQVQLQPPQQQQQQQQQPPLTPSASSTGDGGGSALMLRSNSAVSSSMEPTSGTAYGQDNNARMSTTTVTSPSTTVPSSPPLAGLVRAESTENVNMLGTTKNFI